MNKTSAIFLISLLSIAIFFSVPYAKCATYVYNEAVTVAELISGAKNSTELNVGSYTLEIFDHVTYVDAGLYSIYLLDASGSGTRIDIYRTFDEYPHRVYYHDIVEYVANSTAIQIANTTYAKLSVDVETFTYGTYYLIEMEKSGYTNATSIGYTVLNLNSSDTGYVTVRISNTSSSNVLSDTIPFVMELLMLGVVVGILGGIAYKKYS